ncbi:hypothetical protein [Algoriphagus terrigena]|uniref:hypothetical protein n=1 Tax=Algoriphagus terrigena TaxID=344884 RepID=UPI000478EE13|nr:hypothetical protein [Algoriphagus terrigena]
MKDSNPENPSLELQIIRKLCLERNLKIAGETPAAGFVQKSKRLKIPLQIDPVPRSEGLRLSP